MADEKEEGKISKYEAQKEKEFAQKSAAILKEFEDLLEKYKDKVPHISNYEAVSILFDNSGNGYNQHPRISINIQDYKYNNTNISFSNNYGIAYVDTDVVTVHRDERKFDLDSDDNDEGIIC